jgi:CheY-like chemotaxis protein
MIKSRLTTGVGNWLHCLSGLLLVRFPQKIEHFSSFRGIEQKQRMPGGLLGIPSRIGKNREMVSFLCNMPSGALCEFRSECSIQVRGLVNVLLIEDNPKMERFIRAALARRLGDGVRIESQSTLSQALDTLRSQIFHAIVVDFSAPDLQAPEGLARVATMAQRFPVVVLIDQEQTDLLIAARLRHPQLARKRNVNSISTGR